VNLEPENATPTTQTAERDRECPGCDTATPGEWDQTLRRYFCSVCSTTWRPRLDRRPVDQEPRR